MPDRLYNIMVPVDFSGKNRWAIAKAVELANHFHSNIHLVHVVHPPVLPLLPVAASFFTPYESHAARMDSYEKLKVLASSYRYQLCGHGNIEISITEGNPAEKIAEYVRQYEMDMIVVGLSRFNLVQRILSSVSISRLAQKTNVPVLAVRSDGLICHFKKIILPLDNDLSLHRIKLATLLGRTFKSTIYLLTLRKENNTPEKIISDALQLVQSISTLPVQGIILEGKNLAKATMDFAKRINADLIMINPLKEFHMPGWWNRLTRKLLSYESGIPVITVHKAPKK
jgi:nucleotide-binding universal stress UspA family protein